MKAELIFPWFPCYKYFGSSPAVVFCQSFQVTEPSLILPGKDDRPKMILSGLYIETKNVTCFLFNTTYTC